MSRGNDKDNRRDHKQISAAPRARADSVRDSLQGVVGNTHFCFPKQDLVLLVMKTLAEMGCRDTVAVMQRETGLATESPSCEGCLAAIAGGDWAHCLSLLGSMRLPRAVRTQMRGWVSERQYLEHVLEGRLGEALEVLRGGMLNAERKHALALCLVAPDPTALEATRRSLDIATDRAALAEKVAAAMPADMAVPSRRLETLLLQAMAFQSLRRPDYTIPSTLADTGQGPRMNGVHGGARPCPLANILASERNTGALAGNGNGSGTSTTCTYHQHCGVQLDSDQRYEFSCDAMEGRPGYMHSLFSDMENIDIDAVLPRRQLSCLRAHTNEVWCVLACPDGSLLASSSLDGSLRIWDMRGTCSTLLARCADGGDEDGEGTPAGEPSECSVVPVEEGAVIHSLSWSTDGRCLLGCTSVPSIETFRDQAQEGMSEGSSVHCWAVDHGNSMARCDLKLLSTSRHHSGPVVCAKFVPSTVPGGTELNPPIARVDCTSLECMLELILFVSVGETDENILLCDAKFGTNLAELAERGPIRDIAVLAPQARANGLCASGEVVKPSGLVLYVSDEAVVKLCSIELCREEVASESAPGGSYYYRFVSVSTITLPHSVLSLGTDCERGGERHVVASLSGDCGCALLVVKDDHISFVKEFSLDPLAQAIQERYVLRAALGSQSRTNRLRLSGQSNTDGEEGRGGEMVASGREDGSIVLWRRDRRMPLTTLRGHTGSVNDVCWIPGTPRLLVSASDDRSIRLWY